MFQSCHDDLCMLMKFISNSSVVHISANTFAQLSHPTVISVTNNLVFALNRWNSNYAGQALSGTYLSAVLGLLDNLGVVDEVPEVRERSAQGLVFRWRHVTSSLLSYHCPSHAIFLMRLSLRCA